VKNMVDVLHNRLVAILRAGDIPVTEENLFVLTAGVTRDELAAETPADKFRRHAGLRGGLDVIELNYEIEREVFAERFPLKAEITMLKKHVRALDRQVNQEWFRRHLVKFGYFQPDLIENLCRALHSLQKVKVRESRREPETYLFASLYELFVRLGSQKTGFGDPFYSFAKLATQYIDPDLSFPERAAFKTRLKKHRRYSHGTIVPWHDDLRRKLTDNFFGGRTSRRVEVP
jgi:hypothetical protein